MRIALYGGSFNPVHYGHITAVTWALRDLNLDRLIILPANVNPLKAGVRSTPTLWDRLSLVRAAFAPFEKVVIDDRELRRGGVSYAIDTVREIAAENPGAKLFYIVGHDIVETLPRWKDIEELKTLVTFHVYTRTKESSTEVRSLFENAGVRLNPDAKMVETVRAGVLRRNGYCPCRIPKTPEFFCPCEEFRQQLADPAFHGLCHCRLYQKP